MQLVMKKKNFDNTSLERKQSEIKYKERHTTNNTKPTEKTVYGCRGLIDNIFFYSCLLSSAHSRSRSAQNPQSIKFFFFQH